MIIKVDEFLDATHIFRGLWQGGKPLRGRALADAGFDVVVLCADEHQPHFADFEGVEVISAPFNDNYYQVLPESEELVASEAATTVAARIAEGKKVLVTCYAGLNRSGLVSALAMHILTGVSGRACLEWVQNRRALSLHNPNFQKLLSRLKSKVNPETPLRELDFAPEKPRDDEDFGIR